MKDISVILPVHEFNPDIATWLKMAVKSVNTQIVKPEKLIIVYDPQIESQIKSSITEEESKDIVDIIEYLPNTTNEFDFCSQINFAASKITTEYFSFLEVDDEYSRIWFKNVKRYIDAYPDVGVFLPIVVETDPNGNFITFTNETVWAKDFSEELGVLDNNTLSRYANFNFDGMVIKTETFNRFGKLKSSIQLSFIYEFLLRLTYNDVRVMIIPKLGYRHTNQRPGSLFIQYQTNLSQDEAKFWLNLAKKEYFFKDDRKITYDLSK
jgi:hypothetical protein